jgi:hypothetical protein
MASRLTDSNAYFDVYVGVDQTGAIYSSGSKKGLPKPLAASILFEGTLYTGLSLPKFNENEIRSLVTSIVSMKNPKVFVAVDAVLGLPAECDVSFNQLLEKTAQFRTYRTKQSESLYGRDAAFDFFLQFLKPKLRAHLKSNGRAVSPLRLPERKCERLAKANSVFNRVPAQRNIGCGSYRILSDLASSFFGLDKLDRIRVWPHQPIDESQMTIAETYPSLMWKILGISRTRQERDFISYCKSNFTVRKALKFSSDHIDAAVSAIGAKHVIETKQWFRTTSEYDFDAEGWILGLDQMKIA